MAHKELYVENSNADFTQNRKLPLKELINQVLSMNGGSLNKELYDFSQRKKLKLTASAFVQQRLKLSSIAFKEILYRYNKRCKDRKKHHGYRLLAVDDTDINCFRNPASENFFSTSQVPNGYNQIHLNALYDICNRTYYDIHLQPRKKSNERNTLIHIIKESDFQEKSIIITDGVFESYNMFAHFINTDNIDYLCRVKHRTGAMTEVTKLPREELDKDVEIEITTTQTNDDKIHGRRFIQTGSKKGKINNEKTRVSNWDFESPYKLRFRIVRFMLDTEEYETIATSLNRTEFSINEIKELYHMRWGIETSFRELKYLIGLTHLHSKKDNLIEQEIYTAIIMYNYCSRMSGSAAIKKYTKCK